jgi:SAM-dependent methyltransferase
VTRSVRGRERTPATFKSRGQMTAEERNTSDLARLSRVRKEDGTSFENRAVDRSPRRPPFCMVLPDVAELGEGSEGGGVYGMYPAALIPKLLPWLGCARSEILHVCSGGLPPGEGIRVDVRPEARPDIVADGRALPLADGSVAAVLIDPPYSEHYARELYGTDYPRPAHLLAEAVRVVRPCGRIGIVHYIVPNPPEGAVFIRCFGLSMGFGYPMRAVTLYERRQASLFDGEAPPTNARQARRRAASRRL